MSQRNPTDLEADAYAIEYIKVENQRASFRAAFPTSTCPDKTADEKASTLFKTEKVQESIGKFRAIASKKLEEKFTISVEELTKTLSKVMKKGLSDRLDAEGKAIGPQNLGAVVSAIAEVNKMCGNHASTKVEITTSVPWDDVAAGIDE